MRWRPLTAYDSYWGLRLEGIAGLTILQWHIDFNIWPGVTIKAPPMLHPSGVTVLQVIKRKLLNDPHP